MNGTIKFPSASGQPDACVADRNGAAALKVAPHAQAKPDIRAMMAEIRTRIKADAENNPDKSEPFKPSQVDTTSGSRRAGELLHSEELRQLNQHLIRATTLNLDAITSPRSGPIGKLVVSFKRKILGIVWEYMLKDFWDYQKNVVRFLNDVSKYVDARDASNFWELIRKIDYDITKALERIERIADEQTASRHTSERAVGERVDSALLEIRKDLEGLARTSQRQSDVISTLDAVVRGLEGIISGLGKGRYLETPPQSSLIQSSQTTPDFSYLLLENRFRGGEAEIAKRLGIYPDYFKGATKPVLEIGGGRGELQELFKKAGVPSYAVDSDEGMVRTALEKGVDMRLGDGIDHLRSVPDKSLGGIVAVQVVEHLSRGVLEELITLCACKVDQGGIVIFETIDPRSVLALSSNYFRDPTHVWPLHPDTLAYAMTLGGLSVIETRHLSPVPEQALLKKIAVEEYMTPRWAFMVERINRNFEQLNGLLYGFQDYCVIARAGA